MFETFVSVDYSFTSSGGGGYHNISNITFSPSSPANILLGDFVDVNFDYETDETRGVRIFVEPFTNGEATPNSTTYGSPLYPVGSGSGSSGFSVSSEAQHVDQVRIQMYDPGDILLFETFVSVDYSFSISISIIPIIQMLLL